MTQLSLRPLRVEDADQMVDVLADPSLYEFTGGEPPTHADLARQYGVQVRGHSVDGSEVWLNSIVLLAGEPIGYVQATIRAGGDEAEIAWVIGKPWQGNGYGSAAAELLVAELAERRVNRLVAHVHPDHVASNLIAERLGLAPTETVVDGEVRWASFPA